MGTVKLRPLPDMEAIQMKQKSTLNFKARNSFFDISAVPLFIAVMVMTSFASIFSEASASDTLAYIPNTSNSLTVIDTSTNNVVADITVGNSPEGVAVNAAGTYVYVTNFDDSTVSVINTSTNTVVNTIPVGKGPEGIAVNTAGTYVYTANFLDDTVSVINTGTNTVVNTYAVGSGPEGIVVNSAGTYVYTANFLSNNVSVIDTGASIIINPIPVGSGPEGIAINSAGTYVYVTNGNDSTVSVIATSTNTVVHTIPVGRNPGAIAVNSAGTYVYTANFLDNTVSVINTSTNTVVGNPISVGDGPDGIAVNTAGTNVYAANEDANSLSVIATSNNSVIATINIANGVSVVAGNFLSPGTFSDVTSTTDPTFYNYIEAIYEAGITTGCVVNVDYECPSPDVTRDQMAAFIIRALYGENFTCTGGVACSTTTPIFSDVPSVTANQFFPYIQKLYELGITTGCQNIDGNLYYECPSDDNVTRDQMAAFIVRALQVQAGLLPDYVVQYPSTPYFQDVTSANPFFPYIQKLYKLGITTGCQNIGGNLYYECPSDDNVTRDQMAAFIARAFMGMK